MAARVFPRETNGRTPGPAAALRATDSFRIYINPDAVKQ
jgi:hypothetical protein